MSLRRQSRAYSGSATPGWTGDLHRCRAHEAVVRQGCYITIQRGSIDRVAAWRTEGLGTILSLWWLDQSHIRNSALIHAVLSEIVYAPVVVHVRLSCVHRALHRSVMVQ